MVKTGGFLLTHVKETKMWIVVAEPVRAYRTLLKMKFKGALTHVASTPEETLALLREAPKGSVLVTALFFPGSHVTGWDLASAAHEFGICCICCSDRVFYENERIAFDKVASKAELSNVCEELVEKHNAISVSRKGF